jgi:hypothetical protein
MDRCIGHQMGNAPRTTIFIRRVHDVESNGGWAAFTSSGPRLDASDDAALASYTNRTTMVVRIAGLPSNTLGLFYGLGAMAGNSRVQRNKERWIKVRSYWLNCFWFSCSKVTSCFPHV